MKRALTALFLILALFAAACDKHADTEQNADTATASGAAKVTFVELGSVNCIPCKAMQPVMKAIEKEFGSQIHVVFYDVKVDPSMAQKYKIGLIPTQVFLDENGQEFHRHEGFYPEAEITKILVAQGLSPKSGADS